ncbi:uncharacterized protein kmr isoform X2 [Euwallacea fornicatus]|uniref:uncharacterized protein kmr isoform X2 n=1 Tax=Euwallacea fornicatus TaxID=995702 RepID=UPI00338EDF97
MFSCLWQIWEWLDPHKMDKLQKSHTFENQSQDTPNNDPMRHTHQHITAPQFYPMMHQHPQIYNKGHPHRAQSPFLLNINSQQVMHQTAHRHFQQYVAQYAHQHNTQVILNPPQQATQIPIQNEELLKQENSKEPESKTQTPKHKTKEGEKKQLRSPSARRPPNAPVTLQGWLHKQGSEGLMLWRKRWFVLSEYCLFYYKGSQEEKVLGSILLPSYKVSICGPNDKVTRKFAFKCEHANMRTYILAADSHDLMMQWIHVLNLACNLQINAENQRLTSEPNSFKSNSTPSGQTIANNPLSNKVVHNHTSSNTTEFSNSSQQELNQYNQPLYANAPPKPRRMTDGYCSPGPEILDRYSNYPVAKSPSTIYGRANPQEQLYHDAVFMAAQNVDRRTPEAYGRSNLTKYRNPSDYEDIYTEQGMYKRPLSPVAPDSVLKRAYPTLNVAYPMIKGYAPPPMEMLRRPYPDPVPMRRTPVQTISRPHSADFLEYKPQKLDTNPSVLPMAQQRRPKSSLDINICSKDCDLIPRPNHYFSDSRERDNDYFYSQERYAEKMRKSAQYLQKMPLNYQQTDPSHRKHRERYDLDTYSYNQPFKEQEIQNFQPVRSRSALSESSLLENDSISREYFSGQDQQYMRTMAPDQFTRSASARLAQSNNFEENVTRLEGERKREESMKRLLEWKQRMLQSPLNRKAHQTQAYRGYLGGKENTYMSPNYEADKKQKKSTMANRRSAHNLLQYNSYSSDDEENGEKSSEHTQAGRTMDTFPNNSDSLTHASFTSTTALNPPDEPVASTSFLTNKEGALPECSVAQLSATDDTAITTDIKSSGALVKAILSEFQNPCPDDLPILEGNYMPMSSQRNVLHPSNDIIEENHYVEMTRSVDSTLLDPGTNDQQQYEMVCFRDGMMEPVYMELPKEKMSSHELPDILKNPAIHENKSDSSDADEEACKDNIGKSRFSLSDSFRPASYYLGVSKAVPEFQDSSDSELVSPPPIPTSSPPLDDEDYIPTLRVKVNDSSNIVNRTSEEKGSFLSLRDLDDNLSRLSSNSGSIVSLTPNCRRPVSEDLCTPTEYEKIENIQSVEKYFEVLKLSEDVSEKDAASEDGGHAYENFSVSKRAAKQEALASNSMKKRLGSPNPLTEDFKPRCSRPDSSCSISAEISFFVSSNRSTPIINETQPTVPYYYSDLSNLVTLNNQRESVNGSKRDITRIINPLNIEREGKDTTKVLAAQARSASADFLNLTGKSGNIDRKNIFESDTLKRHKALETSDAESRNCYLQLKADKFQQECTDEKRVRKSYSLEGLIENVLNESFANESSNSIKNPNTTSEGSYLWEEDSVWREQLRSVSQRHTKSMDDLDSIEVDHDSIHKKHPRAITREVTYVNDILFKPESNKKPGKGEIKKKGSFLIDRETLRQWDLMSSAPSDDQVLKVMDPQGNRGYVVVDSGEGSTDTGDSNGQAQEAASGSISISTKDTTIGRDTFPRGSSLKSATPTIQNMQARSATNLDRAPYSKNMPTFPSWMPQSQSQYLYEREQDFRTSQRDLIAKPKINVSAGELLGRTHEELVLLLIQLRRQQAQTFQAIESCYNEIDTLQLHMRNLDQIKRMENLQKLERIKQNLLELEKQYEKRKPLVNLVDNMVKLGTLYKNPNERSDIARHIRERLEFNQYVQERRLLAEEKREWNRTEPNHFELQEKVRQLYQLDGLIQEESRNLHNLQRDKEDIERALGGLRNRLLKGLNTPEEIEQARRQQFILENELSRVHLMLAQNSKKLEETVAGNARLEQELLMLKQKLQNSRQHRTSPQFSNAGDSLPYLSGSSSHVLESDLERVQKKIGDLQKQREELSFQVRQLTDRSNTPNSQQNRNRSSPIDQSLNGNKKKPGTSTWRETDLDTMNSIDHGYDSYSSTSTTPLYINTDAKPLIASTDFQDRNVKTSDSTSDDIPISSNPLEKPEIKTVRIVKRESERRQRDREKTFNGKCDPLVEEDDSSQRSSVLFRPQSAVFEHHSLPTRTNGKPAELSPVFTSEAARQIITEVSTKSPCAQSQRRPIPKEHRRHHTAPQDNSVILGSLEGRRARDDLDIERALRQRIDAPDLVRSTLSNKDLKYNEETIDNILSTPNKILIPERYIPEHMPQPSVEEQEKRKKKVESIKKMLSDTAIISAPTTSIQDDKKSDHGCKSSSTSSISEEKKQREHLLQLNQILAKQVMEMSKVVAVKNLQALKFAPPPMNNEEEDSSPVTPLPLYQQRENFYS